MLNDYYITLAAGTRVGGAKKYGSLAEQSMHEQHLLELKNLLGDRIISYDNNTGFVLAKLYDDEANDIAIKSYIYRVSKVPDITLCPITNFSSYATSSWHMGLLSNNIYSLNTRLISGFNLRIDKRQYGIYPIDYDYVNELLVLSSENNKLLHNNEFLNFEYSFDSSNEMVLIDLNAIQDLKEGNYYIVYNIISRIFTISNVLTSNLIVIGSVDLKLNNSSIVGYYSAYSDKFDIVELKLISDFNHYITAYNGSDVEVIIGDTHIDYNLSEFDNRATLLYNPYSNIFNTAYIGELDTGYASHGTLVACALAGKTYGMAKHAKILGVTLFDYSEGEKADGSSVNPSDKVLIGLQYIAGYIDTKKVTGNLSPTVVNLSIKMSSTIPEVDDIIEAMIEDGAVVVIAAGNDNIINNHSPYSENAIIVASCDNNLKPSLFTEYGPRITVYAPGENIAGLMNGGVPHTWSGTSVACPIVAGLCAIYLSMCPESSVKDVKIALINNAVKAITYNKLYTTNLFMQHISYGYHENTNIKLASLSNKIILSLKPYLTNFDDEPDYGNSIELTLDDLMNTIISIGSIESIDIGTMFKLQR